MYTTVYIQVRYIKLSVRVIGNIESPSGGLLFRSDAYIIISAPVCLDQHYPNTWKGAYCSKPSLASQAVPANLSVQAGSILMLRMLLSPRVGHTQHMSGLQCKGTREIGTARITAWHSYGFVSASHSSVFLQDFRSPPPPCCAMILRP